MADNSLQGGNDAIRDIDRSGTGPKTQVVQLDHGGTGAGESLTSINNPLPVNLSAAPIMEVLLGQILTELRVNNVLLQIGLGIKDDPAELRDDYAQLLN